jgi:hypothetical protein
MRPSTYLVLVLVSGDRDYVNWVKLSRLYLKMETESSLRNVMFLNLNRMVF